MTVVVETYGSLNPACSKGYVLAEDASGCACPPCPGRGNDGHAMTHCAECCYGTGVEADPACPVHGDPSLIGI